jgi:hypothetical protein
MDCVENFQTIDAQQANLIGNYRNTKYKLLKNNAGDKYVYLTYYVRLVGIQRSDETSRYTT